MLQIATFEPMFKVVHVHHHLKDTFLAHLDKRGEMYVGV